MTLDDAIKTYQKVKKKLGRVPYRKELPASATKVITKKYSNWFDFLATQGDAQTTPSNRKMSRYISDDQLLAEVKALYRKLGYPPHRRDYKRTSTAINHFGSWQKFLAAAGIKATYVGLSQYTQEEVIYKVQKYIDQYHEFPGTDDIPETGISIDTVLRLFGSIDGLAKALNSETKRVTKPRQKEELLLQTAEKMKKNHQVITRNGIAQESGLTTIQVSGIVARYKAHHHIKFLSFVEYMHLHGYKAKSLHPIKRKTKKN